MKKRDLFAEIVGDAHESQAGKQTKARQQAQGAVVQSEGKRKRAAQETVGGRDKPDEDALKDRDERREAESRAAKMGGSQLDGESEAGSEVGRYSVEGVE